MNSIRIEIVFSYTQKVDIVIAVEKKKIKIYFRKKIILKFREFCKVYFFIKL